MNHSNQPGFVGECNNCGRHGDLWHRQSIDWQVCSNCGQSNHVDATQCIDCYQQIITPQQYICHRCYEDITGISLGEKCYFCGRWDELQDGLEEIDTSEERYLYSQLLTEDELDMYFGYSRPVRICTSCSTNQNEYKPSYDRIQSYKGTGISLQWADRSAMSNLGVVIIRDIFEAAGYQTMITGYEQTPPHLVKMRNEDPSQSYRRIASTPDLEVVDPEREDVYRIEVKTTTLSPPDYKLKTRVVNELRQYHDDAYLVVYHIPSSSIFAQKIRFIPWDTLPIQGTAPNQFYVMQFAGDEIFGNLPQFFDRITQEGIRKRLEIMRELFRRYFIGLELDLQTDSY